MVAKSVELMQRNAVGYRRKRLEDVTEEGGGGSRSEARLDFENEESKD